MGWGCAPRALGGPLGQRVVAGLQHQAGRQLRAAGRLALAERVQHRCKCNKHMRTQSTTHNRIPPGCTGMGMHTTARMM